MDVDSRNDAMADLAEMLECLPEPVIIVTEDGKIAYVNRYIETFLGYTNDELLGAPLDVLVPETVLQLVLFLLLPILVGMWLRWRALVVRIRSPLLALSFIAVFAFRGGLLWS